jgi:putative transposase
MDERHLQAAARYVLLNPVRAGLAQEAIDWPHSSLRAHLDGKPDGLVDVTGLETRIPDWHSFLRKSSDWSERTLIRRHECSGFPLGDERFLHFVELQSGRKLEADCSWIRRPG